MSKLIDLILEQIHYDCFTDAEMLSLAFGSKASRYNQVKRALAKGDLLQIRRGLYCLAKRYQRQGVNAYELASKIYGPSYVSFETALSYHGYIPEAVYTLTCASAKRSREYKTPLGVYTYKQIPIRAFLEGVERIEKERTVFLMATPLKAIVDIIYANRLDWKGVEPLTKSLRIERENLNFNSEDLVDLELAYRSVRVSRFIKGLRKDLHL